MFYQEKKFPPVLTKKDFVRRFMANEFGNRGPNLATLVEFLASNYQGLTHIRNKQAGGPTWYDIESQHVSSMWIKHGCRPETHYLAGMAPTAQTLFQGEVQLQPGGLVLYYSTEALTMRAALASSGKTATGIIAVLLLKAYLCPASYDWLTVLLDRYPDHVIEFSTYSCQWGTIPGFNTIFWEVRKY